MAEPEEIGRGIVFLASPASSYTTGTNPVIDRALTRGVQKHPERAAIGKQKAGENLRRRLSSAGVSRWKIRLRET